MLLKHITIERQTHMIKIAFYDAKEYDKQSFMAANADNEFDIRYLETRLTKDTYKLAEGCDVVCVFVNDDIDRFVIDRLCGKGSSSSR